MHSLARRHLGKPAGGVGEAPSRPRSLAGDERVLRRISAAGSLSDGVERLSRELESALPHRWVWLTELDGEGSQVAIRAASAAAAEVVRLPARVPCGPRFADCVLRAESRLYVRGRRGAVDPFDAALEGLGTASHISIGLAPTSSSPLRVLTLAAPSRTVYGADEVARARRLSACLGAALSLAPASREAGAVARRSVLDPEEMVEYVCRALAHDVRNIMAGILGAMELGQGEGEADEAMQQVVRRRVLDGLAMVEAMDRRLRRHDGEPAETVELLGLSEAVVEAVASVVAARVAPQRRPVLMCEGTEAWAAGNAGEVRRALVALLFNAVRSAGAGGSVDVRCEAGARSAVLEVWNTGEGISDVNLRHVKAPFCTTLQGDHLGLGLTIADGVARRYDGGLVVHKGPDGRTCIKLSLPLAKRPFPSSGQARVGDAPSEEVASFEPSALLRSCQYTRPADED